MNAPGAEHRYLVLSTEPIFLPVRIDHCFYGAWWGQHGDYVWGGILTLGDPWSLQKSS